jgi:NADPH:quinone reductase-like Zn-dependent oxidoreductase
MPQPKPNEAAVEIGAAGVNFMEGCNCEGRYKVLLPFSLGQEEPGT